MTRDIFYQHPALKHGATQRDDHYRGQQGNSEGLQKMHSTFLEDSRVQVRTLKKRTLSGNKLKSDTCSSCHTMETKVATIATGGSP